MDRLAGGHDLGNAALIAAASAFPGPGEGERNDRAGELGMDEKPESWVRDPLGEMVRGTVRSADRYAGRRGGPAPVSTSATRDGAGRVEEAGIDMYLDGVSVRRVEDITEALSGTRVSPSTVSNLNKKTRSISDPVTSVA